MKQILSNFEITIKYSDLWEIQNQLEFTMNKCLFAISEFDNNGKYCRDYLEETKNCLKSFERKIDKLLPEIKLDEKPF